MSVVSTTKMTKEVVAAETTQEESASVVAWTAACRYWPANKGIKLENCIYHHWLRKKDCTGQLGTVNHTEVCRKHGARVTDGRCKDEERRDDFCGVLAPSMWGQNLIRCTDVSRFQNACMRAFYWKLSGSWDGQGYEL